MEEGRIVYRFQKSPEEEIRFTVKEYKGRSYLNKRLWFLPSGGSEYDPTKKGLSLSLDYLPALMKGLERTAKLASESALQDASNPVK